MAGWKGKGLSLSSREADGIYERDSYGKSGTITAVKPKSDHSILLIATTCLMYQWYKPQPL